jgi:hypothetical protein
MLVNDRIGDLFCDSNIAVLRVLRFWLENCCNRAILYAAVRRKNRSFMQAESKSAKVRPAARVNTWFRDAYIESG